MFLNAMPATVRRRRALDAWGLENLAVNPDEYSNVVTTVLMPEGYNADSFRQLVLDKFDMSLGAGLGKVAGKVFRLVIWVTIMI